MKLDIHPSSVTRKGSATGQPKPFRVTHSDIQNAYIDAFIVSGEYVTLVDISGHYFHGRVISHDTLSLVLGSNNVERYNALFNKRVISMIVPFNQVQRSPKPPKPTPKTSRAAKKTAGTAPVDEIKRKRKKMTLNPSKHNSTD